MDRAMKREKKTLFIIRCKFLWFLEFRHSLSQRINFYMITLQVNNIYLVRHTKSNLKYIVSIKNIESDKILVNWFVNDRGVFYKGGIMSRLKNWEALQLMHPKHWDYIRQHKDTFLKFIGKYKPKDLSFPPTIF